MTSVLVVGLLPVMAQEATPLPEAPPVTPTAAAEVNPMSGNAVVTKTLPFDEGLLERLQLPEGFAINVFAQNLGNARMIAVAPDGTIFVTRREEGDVIALTDEDGDGRADSEQFTVVVSDQPWMHGITFHQNRLYLATDREVYVANWQGGTRVSGLQPIIRDLPDGGQHPNRTLAVGPDEMLYITVGSTCNACDDSNPENATILRARLNGAQREIFATGLRNTIGFGWHPDTGELWGMDHGTDWRGDDTPTEELNRLQQGMDYGWPFCLSNREPDEYLPQLPPGNVSRYAYCQRTTAPVLQYTAHSAPLAMVFYTAEMFPEEFRGDAFIAMRGSWNRNPPSGYEIVRLRFEDGQPTEFQPFVTGFLIEDELAHFARLAGMAVAPDGALLFTDDTNGVMYRLAYRGE
jgi:glucose/arabinose dehydrogenase